MTEPSSRRHIALYLPSLRGGGAERVMVNLARGFAEQGFKVDLVLARAEGPYLAEVPKEVRVVDLAARRVLYSLPGLIRYIRRERPEAMLSTLNHANVIALWARKISRVPLRLIIREAVVVEMSARNAATIQEKLMTSVMRLFYSWADGVVALSQGVSEDFMLQGFIEYGNRIAFCSSGDCVSDQISDYLKIISLGCFLCGGNQYSDRYYDCIEAGLLSEANIDKKHRYSMVYRKVRPINIGSDFARSLSNRGISLFNPVLMKVFNNIFFYQEGAGRLSIYREEVIRDA